MRNKNRRLKLDIMDNEFNEKIYSGMLGPEELTRTVKKIKKKYT